MVSACCAQFSEEEGNHGVLHDTYRQQRQVSIRDSVRDSNVDQAMKALKKKLQREGVFREMKLRNFYEKPSEKRARGKAEAIRRARKLARKRAQRESGVAAAKK